MDHPSPDQGAELVTPHVGRLGLLGRATWQLMIGRPLRTSEVSREAISPVQGLPALSLDALTSVAYGPEAIAIVLASAGLGALHLMLPITLAIVVLLVLLVSSYRQVIEGYPQGGGAYAVSRANFGPKAGQLAAGALIVDYVLTVAVSIAAGVDALGSAFPAVFSFRIWVCLGILALVMILNLRGLGESARAFFLPTALFIVGLLGVLIVGLIHPLDVHISQPGRSLVATHALEAVGILLVLKAFSSGCSALTGVEAIANSVPVFREPKVTRAKQTELLLGIILAAMLLGIALIASIHHLGPRSGDTLLSQVMALSVGRSWAYFLVSIAITVVLGLAANTSFGSLPVLMSLLAKDNLAPHPFGVRGDRLVYSRGVWALAIVSGVLLVAVGGHTQRLIPMYAIGVFTGFTLAQGGMVLHWRRERPHGWRFKAGLNGLGSFVTAAATIIFILTKFLEGAFVVLIAVPLMIYGFRRVQRYYDLLGKQLGIGEIPSIPVGRKTLVVVLVTEVSRLSEEVLSDALSMGEKVVALAVIFTDDLERGARLSEQWQAWSPGVELDLVHSEYHSVVRPVLRFLESDLAKQYEQVVVLIPVVVPSRLRYRLLHNQLDIALAAALRTRDNVVVARVAFKPLAGRRSEEALGLPASSKGARDEEGI